MEGVRNGQGHDGVPVFELFSPAKDMCPLLPG